MPIPIFLLLLSALLAAVVPMAQGAEACAKTPEAWTLEARADAGAVCAEVLLHGGEEGKRWLRVFESGVLAFASEDAAACKTCGGVRGDPFQGLRWAGLTLAVSNGGGSRENWEVSA